MSATNHTPIIKRKASFVEGAHDLIAPESE